MMEPESNWRPHILFVASEENPPGRQALFTVLSTDTAKLDFYRSRPEYRGYRVAWVRASKDSPRIDGKFIIRHYEPPRSIFDEGDWLVGVYADAVPNACALASDIDHWQDYGLSRDSDWIGILTPLEQD